VDAAGFAELMETIARSWNEGDTSRALECFTNDVVYMEPPDEQLYTGEPSSSSSSEATPHRR